MTEPAEEIIDVHMHCFTGRGHAPVLRSDLARLRQEGVRQLCVVAMVNTRLDQETMWNLIPDYVENRGNSHFYEIDDLLDLARHAEGAIVPFVDTRHLAGDVFPELDAYLRRGFRGIKGIYLPDVGNDLGIGNVPDTFGMTREEYDRREWEIISFAHRHNLPLLYHIDVRRYGDAATAFLDAFPGLRVNIPHLGIGRKAFSKILERYPNVFTDFAGMISFVRENPSSYRDFILQYPDRVCFATDLLLYQAETVLEYKAMVKELQLPEEVEQQVFSGNARRYLGSALWDERRSEESGDVAMRLEKRPGGSLPPPSLAARWESI